MQKLFNLEKVLWLLLFSFFSVLLFTAVKSGYFYQLDNDELYHSQVTYLIDHGNTLYTSFYTTYTPVFYWILVPVFRTIGYGIEVLSHARALMVLFFLSRIIIIFLAIKSLVSWKAAFFSVFLLVLDPFTVMSGMQIRPDTVMLLFYSLSLYFYIRARRGKNKGMFLISGFFAALSVVVLMKIVPSVVMLLSFAFISAWFRKKLKDEGLLLLGFFLTGAVLFGLFMFQGLLDGLIQQTILDPFVVFSVLLYPVPYGFYLKEGNMWLYGPWGRPIAWVYSQLTLPLAGFGIHSGLETIKNKKIDSVVRDVLLILIGSLITQWLWLITVPSIFIQYYLPINWIIAVLGGIALDQLLQMKIHTKMLRVSIYALYVIVIGTFSYGNIKTNHFRANIRSTDTENRLLSLWKAVPQNSKVFPSVLFRPIAYPLPYRVYFTELPVEVLNRFPSLTQTLEKDSIQYIYNDTGLIYSLPQDTQEYIRANFIPGGKDDEIFIRKGSL